MVNIIIYTIYNNYNTHKEIKPHNYHYIGIAHYSNY